jgi:hypothetical protein
LIQTKNIGRATSSIGIQMNDDHDRTLNNYKQECSIMKNKIDKFTQMFEQKLENSIMEMN